jgi:hypothetical protein
VEQVTVLVTSEGRWVLPGSEEFLAALGDPNPDYDAVGFAVRNLGFIKYQVLDRMVTEIELHPRNVALPALLAIERQLDKPSTKLFRIKHLDTEWRSEIFASPEHTVARLRELCAPAVAEPSSTERFRVEPQDANALLRDLANPLCLLAQKWRTSFGHFDASTISFAIRHQLLPRIMVAEVEPRTLDPVCRYIGDGFTSLGESFPFDGVGQRMEDLPDKDYGGWVTEFYRTVATSGQPRYDLVTAAIKQPSSTTTPRESRYERLLLPWKRGSDEALVTVISRLVLTSSGSEFASLVGDEPATRKLVKSK